MRFGYRMFRKVAHIQNQSVLWMLHVYLGTQSLVRTRVE